MSEGLNISAFETKISLKSTGLSHFLDDRKYCTEEYFQLRMPVRPIGKKKLPKLILFFTVILRRIHTDLISLQHKFQLPHNICYLCGKGILFSSHRQINFTFLLSFAKLKEFKHNPVLTFHYFMQHSRNGQLIRIFLSS